MKIGFALPNIGPIGTAAGGFPRLLSEPKRLGYHSLWTVERLLYPVKPQSPYAATPDGSLPEPYKYVLDPVETLTFAAAYTKTITLGTSVLDIPYYNPVTLARRLTTLDFLSNGRLRVGLGLGWSKDEMEATGADMKKRGAMADEFLQVLKRSGRPIRWSSTGSFTICPSPTSDPSRCRSRILPSIWRRSLLRP